MGGRHFGARVQDVAQTRHGNTGLLEVGPQLCHAHDGHRHALGEHVEGDKLAHGQLVVHYQMRAIPERGRVDQFAHQVDALMRHTGQVLDLEARGDIGRKLRVPALAEGRLERSGLDGLDTGHGFHQHGLVLGATRKLDIQTLA